MARFRMVIMVALALLGGAEVARATVIADFNFNSNDGGFTHTFSPSTFTGPWTYNASGGNWFTDGHSPELGVSMSAHLISPQIVVGPGGRVTLSFDHRYSFEPGNWDGGAVFVSVNSGLFAKVPGSSFTQNGYDGIVLSGSRSELKGQEAFVNTSPNFSNGLLTSIADLGSFNPGDTLQLAFRFEGDTNTRGPELPNWELDNVRVSTTGGVPEPATLAIWSALFVAGCAYYRRRQSRS